jgi:hypothetical protein
MSIKVRSARRRSDVKSNRRSHLPSYADWEIHPVMALHVVQAHARVPGERRRSPGNPPEAAVAVLDPLQRRAASADTSCGSATLICSQRSEEILLRIVRFASGSWPFSRSLMFK